MKHDHNHEGEVKHKLELPEEVTAGFARFKQHMKANKVQYLVGATGGVVAGYFLRGKLGPDVIQTFTDSTDNVVTVINRSKNVDVVIKYLNQRGYVANPVQCLETLEKWGSQAEAAAAKGLTDSCLSQHLNGTRDHAGGFHFVRL